MNDRKMRTSEDGDWRELVAADRNLNIGMPLELLAAEGYACRDGITREDYIIKVLRAERARRQHEDAIAADIVLMDDVIDRARAAGVTIVDFLLSDDFLHLGRGQTWDLSPDFLAKLLTRYQKRVELSAGRDSSKEN
jgi:hypothetical protein